MRHFYPVGFCICDDPCFSKFCRTHSVDCQNVEETRNPMQNPAGRNASIFWGCPLMGQPLILLHLKVINTADQLICDLAELLCTDIHLLESIHYLFRLIVCLLRAVHIALHDF